MLLHTITSLLRVLFILVMHDNALRLICEISTEKAIIFFHFFYLLLIKCEQPEPWSKPQTFRLLLWETQPPECAVTVLTHTQGHVQSVCHITSN